MRLRRFLLIWIFNSTEIRREREKNGVELLLPRCQIVNSFASTASWFRFLRCGERAGSFACFRRIYLGWRLFLEWTAQRCPTDGFIAPVSRGWFRMTGEAYAILGNGRPFLKPRCQIAAIGTDEMLGHRHHVTRLSRLWLAQRPSTPSEAVWTDFIFWLLLLLSDCFVFYFIRVKFIRRRKQKQRNNGLVNLWRKKKRKEKKRGEAKRKKMAAGQRTGCHGDCGYHGNRPATARSIEKLPQKASN